MEAAMPTRNVVITDRQAKLIDTLVSSGHYQNASEVLRDGLRLIEERAKEHKAKLKALRDAVQIGIDDMEAGRYRTFKSSEELRQFLRELTDEVIAETKVAAE
jgi:antitoxin ParD1/3/4